MTELDALIPIKKNEINVGKAVPKSIFDAWGNLLLVSGTVIKDQQQFENLIENGYYSDRALDYSDAKSLPTVAAATITASAAKPTPEQNKETIMLDLDSVHWFVGETFYLQVHDNASIRYTVKLIGFVKNKSILVSAPMVDGKVALIRDGQTFIVRTFPGKKAYAFTASALKSVFSPHPYLHLTYPKVVRCTTIRQGSRATVKIIASVTVGIPEQTAAATLNDLSMGGASGIIKRPLGQKNDTGVIKFKVNAAGSDEFLTLSIILRSIAPTENADEYRHGFEFVDVPTQSKLILSAFVHQTLADVD
ncbi:MAG: flagellar brake protein [Undibacterium sp.]|uniref:flagellar brake protein n=1 Tax=Undibacterium sp. TaxID=1914977 RepID=UPI00272721D4|nr:flagellar brake protein [Undibacterium sp.]MDO8653819.1 flagellar brake protein [Undibacterium sp.]